MSASVVVLGSVTQGSATTTLTTVWISPGRDKATNSSWREECMGKVVVHRPGAVGGSWWQLLVALR